MTFWDAGEFIAAVESFGIPHPPGTPLFVAVGRAWHLLLAPLPTAGASNLLSAVATAAAGGALAAAVCAASMSTVWLNATETEVYAASLALSVVTLVAADQAGRTGEPRWLVLTAYLFGLAAPLHVSALVAAPAAITLAATSARDARPVTALVLGGAFALAAGVGTGAAVVAALGLALMLVAGLATARVAGVEQRDRATDRVRPRHALAACGAVALGVSATAVLLLRARHDPALNQGNPATLGTLLDVLARRQYDVAGLWPRQAPWWIQLGNLFEYADWQFALGLAPGPAPSPWRTTVTVLFALLGLYGAREHRRLDRRSWRALIVLALCASVGVAAYLNLKAGPSFGAGVLHADAPHEARERDYFFVLAFWTWGAWAGLGAVRLAERWRRGAWLGLGVAALPVVLNWRAVDRRREPDAETPRRLAEELLGSAPPRAVLFVWGDNDSYPLWYAQQALRVRRDVTVVTIPLLPARWYRAELARRHALWPADSLERWVGARWASAVIAARARALGRPRAFAVSVPASDRAAAGARWTLAGLAYVDSAPPGRVADAIRGVAVDRATTAAAAARLARWLARYPPSETTDETTQVMRAYLECPALALARLERPAAAADSQPDDSLDTRCNLR